MDLILEIFQGGSELLICVLGGNSGYLGEGGLQWQEAVDRETNRRQLLLHKDMVHKWVICEVLGKS